MISAGPKTVALVSHNDTPDKKIIIYGRFKPMHTENSSRSLNFFNDIPVHKILC